MFRQLLRKKDVKDIKAAHRDLHKILTAFDLTLLGIGAIIGAGVFVLTGVAAATHAGPAIIISYLIAGLASLFAALAYSELAASIGGTGSAYNYAYAGFGEFIAWLIGWNLLLEYTLAVATVAIGWASYVNNFFQALHIYIPYELVASPSEGGIVNILAVGIILLLAFIQCVGVKESTRINNIIVFIKLITILIFIAIAFVNVDPQNWHPFLPYGWGGVFTGAALVFFAYIGFDALSTAAEESINPQRDLPIGIIASLAICTVLYIIVSILLTGVISYTRLNVGSPVAFALLHLGYNFFAGVIAVGAIAGLTSVMLVMFYGVSRICLAMSRDGLLPHFIGHINNRTRTPITAIVVSAVIIAVIAGLAPISKVAELVNIGTLTAFTFVCAGIIILRKTQPHLPRPFKTPFSPFIPALGVLFCGYLMYSLPWITWLRFLIWTAIGVVIYFGYGIRHSVLRNKK